MLLRIRAVGKRKQKRIVVWSWRSKCWGHSPALTLPHKVAAILLFTSGSQGRLNSFDSSIGSTTPILVSHSLLLLPPLFVQSSLLAHSQFPGVFRMYSERSLIMTRTTLIYWAALPITTARTFQVHWDWRLAALHCLTPGSIQLTTNRH